MASKTFNWQEYLDQGETLLWSGEPDHGQKLLEITGQEKVYHFGLLAIILLFWVVMSLAVIQSSASWNGPLWFLGIATICCLIASYFTASGRALVFKNLHYAITDQRALVCRTDFNLLRRTDVRFFECPYREGYLFPVHEQGRYGSVQVGEQLAPRYTHFTTGTGLSHSGRSPYETEHVVPILFENMADAETVQRALLAASEKSLQLDRT